VLLVSGGDLYFTRNCQSPYPSWGESGLFTIAGRHGENDLDILGRDDFKTLARALVVRGYAAIVGLPLDVVAKLLLKPRSGRGKRSDLVRLLGLCCGYHNGDEEESCLTHFDASEQSIYK
jgi:hypothetical protein